MKNISHNASDFPTQYIMKKHKILELPALDERH